ncbi:MAG: NHLP family bacteriocin export ABC transporter peptidase/permease/ATPase subunit [Pseudomonadota bacterium]
MTHRGGAAMRLRDHQRPRGRVYTPTVIQMEAVECGAASLAMMLGYYGCFESLDKLRVACGVSRDGSNAANLVRVARNYGCEAAGYRKSHDDILKGPRPAILFWNNSHFVVFEGASRSAVFINDPIIGHRKVSFSEFQESYSGIMITIQPGEQFEAGGTPKRPVMQLIQMATAYRPQLYFVLILGCLLAVPGFVIPAFMGVFVNDILISHQQDWLGPLIAVLIAAILIQTTLNWVKETSLLRIETHMAAERSANFLWHVLRLPSRFFGMRYLGDITSRIVNIQSIAQTISSEIGTSVVNLFTAIILFALMSFLDPILATLAASGAVLNFVVVRLLHKTRVETSVRLDVEEGKLFGTAVIGLRTIESLKAGGREDDFFAKWSGYHARAITTEQILSRLDQVSALIPGLIGMATMAAALWIGGGRVMDASLTIGGFIAFQVLFAALLTPIQHMVTSTAHVQRVAADLTRLQDVLEHPLDWRHRPGQTSSQSHQSNGSLRFENVTFGYSPLAPPLIENLNLEVRTGGWVALVRKSGSGKSTIGKLASGLYEPWSGRVMIDDRDITSIERRDLADILGAVDQEIVLYEGSMRDNLTLWDHSVSQEALVKATRDAQIFDTISAKSQSFDAEVEENGRNFSGGERQRIEIARALVRDPRLLVLDEATSALDPETEREIMASLRARDVACLVVAHRLSTVRDCDEIIVLDEGRVVDRGTHDDLMSSNGVYSRLIQEGEA